MKEKAMKEKKPGVPAPEKKKCDERTVPLSQRRLLEGEIPYLTADIRAVYKELDSRFHLKGARLPISFGFESDLLGSYTPADHNEEEHFHFSLLFLGHALPNPLSREDRLDLYKHEYAHYMTAHLEVPEKYRWQAGKHGSAWKYCCSLIGAAPTPYYRAGEALMPHDYEAVLTKKVRTPQKAALDAYRQEKEYKAARKAQVLFSVGQEIVHPTFGEGIVEEILPQETSVRLMVRFENEVKAIDQAWLLRAGYRRAGDA